MNSDGGILVRAAEVEDLEVLVALSADAADELRGQRGGPRLLDELEPRLAHPANCRAAIDDPDVAVLCALWEGFVAAFAVVRLEGDEAHLRASITELFTSLEVRDLGCGDALVDAAIRWADARGCVAIDARVVPGAREAKNLFERSGLVARQLIVSRTLRDD